MGSRYLIRKVVGAAFTIVMIVVLNFVLFRMMPG
jgi:ABC-type dipeptide/oligopeptide/nickel transport system permease component